MPTLPPPEPTSPPPSPSSSSQPRQSDHHHHHHHPQDLPGGRPPPPPQLTHNNNPPAAAPAAAPPSSSTTTSSSSGPSNLPPAQYPPPPTTTTSANNNNNLNPANNGSRLPNAAPPADVRAGAMSAANGNGQPVPVPAAAAAAPASAAAAVPHHGRMANGLRGGGFEGPRSPPQNKSTAHVPCKFFKQGACQAGKACPFLHSTEPATDVAPCKYFQKGNCKFGAKCALAHILPDGRRVNRPNFGGIGGGHLNLGGRLPHHNAPDMGPGSSLLTMQAHMAGQPPHGYPYGMPDEFFNPQGQNIPAIDATFSHHPGSTFGSPPNESRLPMSPAQKGLSALDAPLPASFDSQGISHMARYGPIAASVPSRFPMESSPPSSYHSRPVGDSSALRTLHSSAFGDDAANHRNGFGTSPPTHNEDHLFGRRILHSDRYSSSRVKMMSASLGTRPPMGLSDDPWEDNDDHFGFEEDFVPSSLGELLTPQEKMRRFSRSANEEDLLSQSHRQSFSGLGTPTETKVGSPSRFSALFAKTHPKPDGGGGDALSLPGSSAFGHVGSPLRNSSLHPGVSPSLRALNRPPSGDVSPFLASPPRQTGIGMISQQLQRTRLSSLSGAGSGGDEARDGAAAAAVHPGIARLASGSGSSVGSAAGSSSRPPLSIDRAVSTSSVRDTIEEEQGLFSMEEEEDEEEGGEGSSRERRREGQAPPPPSASQPPQVGAGAKRLSGGAGSASGTGGGGIWGGFGFTATAPSSSESPRLGPIGGGRAGSISKESSPWGTTAN